MDVNELTLSDYIDILKRRKWSFILPFLIFFSSAVFLAFLLPPVYESIANILIEAQEIPQDFVQTTVTSYAEQRIQIIKQKMLSSAVLSDLIQKLNLYREDWEVEPSAELISRIRENIQIIPVSSEVVSQRTGKTISTIISFSVSFSGPKPDEAQRVTDVLTSIFLKENLRVRSEQVLETNKFLKEEMAKIKVDLNQFESNISQFKEKNVNALPDLMNFNIQSLNSIEQRIETLTSQLNNRKEKLALIQAELFRTPPQLEMHNRKARLDALRVGLYQLKTKFSDEYPDVIKTKAEIAELERQLAVSSDSPTEQEQRPDNPQYNNLSAQLAASNIEINSLTQDIRQLELTAAEYRQRIEATPKTEEGLRTLTLERDKKQTKYDDLARKLMESEVSLGLEKEQKGERFTLISPASLPTAPSKPNRLAIAMLGLFLGVGAGLGMVTLREYNDQSVHTAGSLARLVSVPVLASIPEIVTRKEKSLQRKKRASLAVGLVILLMVTIVMVHFFVIDLQVLWADLMERIIS
jgi:polysaccharide chain length determinant protein (PEP-CTERM system associated)